MSIHVGDQELSVLYRGARMVEQVWVGDTLVFPEVGRIAAGRTAVRAEGEGQQETLVPWWARTIHVAVVGCGGGGHGGDGTVRRWGLPGEPGKWATHTWTRTPAEGDMLYTVIGSPGAGGAKESPGGAGGACSVTYRGQTITAAGGSGGQNYSGSETSPRSPGSVTIGGSQIGPDSGGTSGAPERGFGGRGGRGGIFGSADPGQTGNHGMIVWIFDPE